MRGARRMLSVALDTRAMVADRAVAVHGAPMDRLPVMHCPPRMLARSPVLRSARAVVQLRLHAMALVSKHATTPRPRRAIDVLPLLMTHPRPFMQTLAMRRVTSMMPNEVCVAPRPIMPAMEERPMPIVPRPVAVHREHNDRNAHLAGIDRQQHAAVMVKKLQVICVNPPAGARPTDIAPVVLGDAAVYGHGRAGRNRRYDREFRRRTGAHVHGCGREARPRHGGGGCADGRRQDSGHGNQNIFHRFSPFISEEDAGFRRATDRIGLCSSGDTSPRHIAAAAKSVKQHKRG
jgi:hypothetical protein